MSVREGRGAINERGRGRNANRKGNSCVCRMRPDRSIFCMRHDNAPCSLSRQVPPSAIQIKCRPPYQGSTSVGHRIALVWYLRSYQYDEDELASHAYIRVDAHPDAASLTSYKNMKMPPEGFRRGQERRRARGDDRLSQRGKVFPLERADGDGVGGGRLRVHDAHVHPRQCELSTCFLPLRCTRLGLT